MLIHDAGLHIGPVILDRKEFFDLDKNRLINKKVRLGEALGSSWILYLGSWLRRHKLRNIYTLNTINDNYIDNNSDMTWVAPNANYKFYR